jgi:hypothetical protein
MRRPHGESNTHTGGYLPCTRDPSCRFQTGWFDHQARIQQNRSRAVSHNENSEELEPGVIVLGAVYFAMLVTSILWLAA